MSANPIKEIKDSLAKIRPYIVTTPTFKTLSFGQTMDLKLEQLQHTGSFKCRGAFNSLLDNEKAKQGVVAASGGNHGAAVAYVAQKLGIKSHIFVPELSGKTKIDLIKRKYISILMLRLSTSGKKEDFKLLIPAKPSITKAKTINHPAIGKFIKYFITFCMALI